MVQQRKNSALSSQAPQDGNIFEAHVYVEEERWERRGVPASKGGVPAQERSPLHLAWDGAVGWPASSLGKCRQPREAREATAVSGHVYFTYCLFLNRSGLYQGFRCLGCWEVNGLWVSMERSTRQPGSLSRDSLLENAHLGGHLGSIPTEPLLGSLRTTILLHSLESKGDLREFSGSYE